jgi:hypothetical protein
MDGVYGVVDMVDDDNCVRVRSTEDSGARAQDCAKGMRVRSLFV